MLPKGPYIAQDEEVNILNYWLENKFYKPEYHPIQGLLSFEEMKRDTREPFCIVNPPPNAYMRPHIGNVSGYAYQDVFLRYNRMKGKKVLGQPGKDHAGIQGEVVVEKIFMNEKKLSKRDMGRETFYKESYEHFQKLMPMVMADEQRIGLSSDYDRNLFTLDPKVVDVVLGTFINLFKDNMVYKGVRIVNWDPIARTTLADIDTERQERETELIYIKYPISKPDPKVLELKNKYANRQIEFIYERNKTLDGKSDLPFSYGKLDGVGIFGLGFDANSSGEKLNGKVVGIQLRLDKEYKLLVLSDNYSGDLKSDIDKIFDFEKNYYAGAHILTFDEYTSDEMYTNGVIVATTRPETMLGDTAVTVNVKDERYLPYINETINLPLVNREIPFITSPRIEKEFGTGAVKLTPAHSYDDYTMMTEWNIENPSKQIGYINIIDKNARMIGPIPELYVGKKTKEASPLVVKELAKLGLIIKKEKHIQNVMIGERSKAVIEQIMSSQWFIDVDKLKGPAIQAFNEGKFKIHPENMGKKYVNWMENLRDWPVSRSLWWGYRIPVWYKGELSESIDENGHVVETINGQSIKNIQDAVELGLAKVQIESPGEGWIQDNDVFDTWFSSGQWPYATLRANDLMDTFFPTQVMETGYDILELWVSRMMMLSLYNEQKIPFENVYLHGLVKAPDGQKMSKSKNNVVAPETVIAKYGADALRLLYVVGNKAGMSYPLSYEKLEGYKRFLNKIWNAAKLVEMSMEGFDAQASKPELIETDNKFVNDLNDLHKKISRHIDKFNIGIAAELLYKDFWQNFCDVYLETVKSKIYQFDREGNPINRDDESMKARTSAQYTMLYSLKLYLKMLHPFIPFITERIWKELPKVQSEGDHESIMHSKWTI